MSDIDWSYLPRDVLNLISNYLSFDPDYIRFRSVCTSWHSAAPKRPQLPWLIAHRKDDNRNETILSHYKLSPSGNQIIPIPELPESNLFGGMPCRGSSHGWMILLDFAAPSILLWNPLTKSKIQLPTLPIFSKFRYLRNKYFKAGDTEYGWSVQDRSTGEVSERMLSFHDNLYYLANHVILSANPSTSADYVALAVCGHGRRLVFYRAGDDAWTLINRRELTGTASRAVFYKGDFYISTVDAVYVCILEQNPRIKKVVSICKEDYVKLNKSYLVESSGDLLLVNGFYIFDGKSGYRFEVFKLELGSSAFRHQKLKLVKLDSLGERALFLGRNHSFSLNATGIAGCRVNSIYYIDYIYTDEKYGAKHFKVYNYSDHSIEFIPKDIHIPHPDWKPCVWFTPSLLP